MLKLPDKPLTPMYRLFRLEAATVQLALSNLACAPNSPEEASYNALVLGKFSRVFESIRQLSPEQLAELSAHCAGCVHITIDLNGLQSSVSSLQYQEKRYRTQLADTEWLIRHQASNQQILSLCSLIDIEDIKRLRLALSMPVGKGRKRMPDFGIRLAIGTDWQNIAADNDLERYKILLQHYPDFELGQLYTIVNEQLKGSRP
ncbi:hypothetical protein [Neisseria leonii]|uniref:hypothetical protein n=1 Tax=Neisseria leonii TaxID=2995413 RepID=UPI00237ADB2E|nr:hypothetical protein [Neisseria sp. 3986]MDD9326448.1 hypothetical protein [Neisseria sp. 3986]